MLIDTMYFGEIEIEEKDIICFEEGIPGFDDVKKFAIINSNENDSPFQWLQCVEDKYPAFPIINPFDIKPDYEFDIDDSTEDSLQIEDPNDLLVYSIVVIPSDDILQMSANLKAPIIVNVKNKKAKQMIMDNSSYNIKHYILEEIIKAKAAMDKEEK